jgi:hypothetical protein
MISPSINNAGPIILPCNGEKTLPVLLTISNYAEKIPSQIFFNTVR